MHEDNDKRMRVNSDDPNSQVCSGRLATAPQRPKPSFIGSCKKRYTPLRKRFLTTKRHASLKEENLKGKTLKEEILKKRSTGKQANNRIYPEPVL